MVIQDAKWHLLVLTGDVTLSIHVSPTWRSAGFWATKFEKHQERNLTRKRLRNSGFSKKKRRGFQFCIMDKDEIFIAVWMFLMRWILCFVFLCVKNKISRLQHSIQLMHANLLLNVEQCTQQFIQQTSRCLEKTLFAHCITRSSSINN